MNGAYEVGAAALRAEQRALEVLANNVANVSTPGFKRTDAKFQEVLAREAQSLATMDAPNPARPMAGGVRVVQQEMLFQQGALRKTDHPLDLAIEGMGLIELIGPGGETIFWRGGRMRVNEDGLLASADGFALRSGIIVPDDAEALGISSDGVVTVRTATDENFEIGRVGLVKADNESAFERLDAGFLRLVEGERLIDAMPGEDGAGILVQGSVEESNVELSKEMVAMLMVQRAFSANAQVIKAADEIAAISNNLKR